MKQIFIIEHLEPKLWPWCLIEYENISKIVGKENFWITNIRNTKDIVKLEKFSKVFKKSVKEMNLKKACILDPEAEQTLNPSDSAKFEYLIFGGILGDYPPKKRTKKELTKFIEAETRDIGKKQLATDNAVYVVNEICKGKKFEDLKFKDKIEIPINKIESVILPFRYISINGSPMISEKIIKYLKNKKGF